MCNVPGNKATSFYFHKASANVIIGTYMVFAFTTIILFRIDRIIRYLYLTY